jgi:dienelactone hydrolase
MMGWGAAAVAPFATCVLVACAAGVSPPVGDDRPPAAIHIAGIDGIALPAWFDKPPGAGPFPVVILLHGCSGLDRFSWRRDQDWAALLHQQGYATLILDSFSPRGLRNVCAHGEFTGAERSVDVWAAVAYLADRPDIDRWRIAAIGFSHGGGTVLNAASTKQNRVASLLEGDPRRAGLAAAIGIYPGCRDTVDADFAAPLLILVGDKDDWTPARYCRTLAARPGRGIGDIELDVLDDATHDFDVPAAAHVSFDHHISYNPEARAKARQEVVDFLARAFR